MDKIGRNDPCPCGSGKKYKNCCLNKDRARHIQKSAWRQSEQVTLDKLFAFAQRPSFRNQLVVAFNLFWNGNYGSEGLNALDREEIGRFMDWYIYDYRLEQSQKRIIELFAEGMSLKLLPSEREQIRFWTDSHLSLYKISAPPEQGLLSVIDLLQGTKEEVLDSGLGRFGLPGDLILGRVLRSSAPAHFSWAAILLPHRMEGELVSFITHAYKEHQEMHTQTTWPQFLSAAGYMFNHYLLKSAAEAGGAREANNAMYYDAYQTIEKLREAEKRLQAREAQEAEERRKAKQRTSESASLRQTQGGILLPGYVQYKGSQEVKR